MNILKEEGLRGKQRLSEIHGARPSVIILESKKLFDVFNIDLNIININDFSHAVSNLCRWCGHCPCFYSVAQHLVLCSKFGRTAEEKMELLLHDLSEGIMADIAKPIKHKLTQYVELEDTLIEAIYKVFNVKYPLSDYVHEIDKKMLCIEFENFFMNKKNNINCWSPKKAERRYLREYYKIKYEIDNGKELPIFKRAKIYFLELFGY